LNKEAMSIYNRAIKEGLARVFDLDLSRDDEWINLLFPIWIKAVHEILIGKGCGCVSGAEDKCFLHLSPAEQIRFVAPDNIYGFLYFLSVIKKGRIRFFDQVFSDHCQALNT